MRHIQDGPPASSFGVDVDFLAKMRFHKKAERPCPMGKAANREQGRPAETDGPVWSTESITSIATLGRWMLRECHGPSVRPLAARALCGIQAHPGEEDQHARDGQVDYALLPGTALTDTRRVSRSLRHGRLGRPQGGLGGHRGEAEQCDSARRGRGPTTTGPAVIMSSMFRSRRPRSLPPGTLLRVRVSGSNHAKVVWAREIASYELRDGMKLLVKVMARGDLDTAKRELDWLIADLGALAEVEEIGPMPRGKGVMALLVPGPGLTGEG